MATGSIDRHYLRLAMYAEAEQDRQREARAKVDARTQQMLGNLRQSRVDDALQAAKRLKAAAEMVITNLEHDGPRAAGFMAAGLVEQAHAVVTNLAVVEAVDDALEIINSETAEVPQ